jgi:integrase
MSYRPHPTRPGHYQIEYWPQGKQGKRKTIVLQCDATTAAIYDADLRNARKPASLQHPCIKDIIGDYLTWCEGHYSPGFVRDLRGELPGILHIFGPLSINRITLHHFDAYQAARRVGKRKAIVSPRTVNKCVNIVKGFVSWAIKRGYGEPLPFKPEQLQYSRPIPRIPSPTEVTAFIAEIKEPLKKAAAYLMAESGLRFSEVMGLRWEDMNLDDQSAIINGKGGKWRLAILTPRVAQLLSELRTCSAPTRHIFVNPRTWQPYTTLKTLFLLAGNRAGVKIHPHLLRHVAGTNVLQVSDLRTTQEFLGHTSLQATMIYTHITRQNVRNAVNRAASPSDESETKI